MMYCINILIISTKLNKNKENETFFFTHVEFSMGKFVKRHFSNDQLLFHNYCWNEIPTSNKLKAIQKSIQPLNASNPLSR